MSKDRREEYREIQARKTYPPRSLLERPIRIRSAIAVLDDRLTWLVEKERTMTPGLGGHSHVVDEIRALTLALTLLHHEAACRKGEEPRRMQEYAVNFIPFAAP